MSEPGKAVFISYASQDVAAARKICEALNAVGVEVWFDQSELVGGDAWDQKIRGQIKSCALFMPVISATTNARREGYFRREWKIAVDRTHDMDEALPFLLPVVIDATTDAAAFVPEKFRDVQWTRLPGGETPAAFADRVRNLLDGETKPTERKSSPSSPLTRPLEQPRRVPVWLWVMIALPVLALVYFLVKPRHSPAEIARALETARTLTEAAVAKTTAIKPTSAVSDAAERAERAYALTQKLNFTRDDLITAENLSKQAFELDPDSPRVWSVRAWVQAAYLMRNWDYSQKRMQDTQSLANRALNLYGADDADALNALAQVLEKQGAYAEQEKLARRAVARDPKNMRSRVTLGRSLIWLNRLDEARAVFRESIALDPTDPLRHYELANSYAGFGYGRQPTSEADVTTALSELDAALGKTPLTSAIMAKAVLLGARRGDLAGMRAQIDAIEKLSLEERSSQRAVFIVMQCDLWERRPEPVFATAALTPETYFDDGVIAMPKAWLTALAYHLQGKENLARQEWQTAEEVLRQHIRDNPADPQTFHAQLAVTLAWLGRDDEAAREIQPLEAAWREDLNMRNSNFLARYYAARGDAARAAPYLQRAVDKNSFLTHPLLRIDPWWDKLRGQPEFDALVNSSGDVASATSALPSIAPSAAKPTSSSVPSDPKLRQAITILDATDTISADIGLAEDLVKEVLAARSTDTEATIAMGRVQTYFLLRGFDRSDERFALARQYAERGLRLAPDNPEALSNMGLYLYTRRTDLPRAAKLFREAIKLNPDEPRYYRFLDNTLSTTPGISDEEVLASAKQTADRFPTDALAQYELARHYRDAGQLEPALLYLDRAIKYGPVANAIIGRAELKLSVLGDETELEKLENDLPERYHSTDRAVYAQFIRACATGKFSLGLDAVRGLPKPWMIDFDYTGPTALLVGELLFLQGKTELAKAEFEEAQAEMGRHHIDIDRNFSTEWLDSWILLRNGKLAEARARNAVIFPELSRPFGIFLGTNWWFSPIPLNLLLGEREKAITLIREAVGFPYARQVIRQALTMDSRMKPWRDDPEIAQLLAEDSSAPSESKTPRLIRK